jgi:hypothetical protein
LPSFAAGAGVGTKPEVVIFNGDGSERLRFLAYEESFDGGVRVAAGDLNGDGIRDFVTGTGVGGGPRVRVFDGLDGKLLAEFLAFEESFRGGVWVAVGDVNGDGTNDIVVGAGVGGGPRVRVLQLDGTSIADFFTLDSSLRTGVSVAVADFNGDGIDEIVTGVGSQVVILSGQTQAVDRIFDTGLSSPITVAAGLNRIVVGSGLGDASTRIFSPQGQPLATEQVYEETFEGGVRVGFSDIDNDGELEILTGAGIGGGPRVRVLSADGEGVFDFFAFDEDLRGGVFVG